MMVLISTAPIIFDTFSVVIGTYIDAIQVIEFRMEILKKTCLMGVPI